LELGVGSTGKGELRPDLILEEEGMSREKDFLFGLSGELSKND